MKALYAGLSLFIALVVLSSLITQSATATPPTSSASAERAYFIPLTQDLGPLIDLLD